VVALSALTQGTYTTQAQQSDGASNTGSSSVNTFVVEISAPTVTLTSPASEATTNNQKPTFGGTAGTAAGDAASVSVKIYSSTNTSGTLVQSLNASVSSGTYSVAPTTGLAEGTYSAQTYQSDAAGNIGQSSANTFTVDTTAPTVSITAPADASSMTGGSPTLYSQCVGRGWERGSGCPVPVAKQHRRWLYLGAMGQRWVGRHYCALQRYACHCLGPCDLPGASDRYG